MYFHAASGKGGGWLLCLLLCALPVWVVGQAMSVAKARERAEVFPYSVVSLGTNARLPQSQVASVAMHPTTREMIISTAKGLVSFDGRSVNPYDVGHAYDRYMFGRMFSSHLYNAPLGLGMNELVLLSEKPQSLGYYTAAHIKDDVWITMDECGQLLWREPATNQWMAAETGLSGIHHISLMGKDSVLLGGQGHTYLYNTSSCTLQYYVKDCIRAITYDSLRAQHYLLGDKLYRPQGAKMETLELPELAGYRIHDLMFVEDQLLMTSSYGLFVWEGTKVERYSEEDVLPTNSLDKLYYEPVSQAIFIATGDRGLLRLLKKRFRSYIRIGNEPLGSSSSVIAWRENHVFFGNHLDLLGLVGDSIYRKATGLSPIFSVSRVEDTLLLGRGDGLHAMLIEGDKELFHSVPCACFIRAVHRDRQGNYWVGTSAGLWKGVNLQKLVPALRNFENVEVTSIFESRSGELWFGSRVNLVVIDRDGRIKHYFSAREHSFAHGVRAFYEDEKGGMWIGTYGGGLHYFDGSRLTALRNIPGYLLGDDIFTLALDKQGYWIMTSNDGVRMVKEQAAYDFLKGKLDYLVPYYFGTDAGIYNPEFNGGFYNNYAAVNGEVFYLPSIKGMVRYDAKKPLPSNNALMFRQLLIDGQVHRAVKNIPRATRFLEFEFSDPSFDPSGNVYYQYRLLGETAELSAWSAPQKNLSVVLSYLKPGNYSIQFRRIDAGNSLNPPYETYDFYVESYFYETNWFYACGTIFFSLLTFVGVTFSQKRRQKRIEYESSMRNTITEMQLGAIQSQMNPHFIFNALNVLVYLISFSSVDKARSFAVSFSILLRKILEQSAKTFLPVAEEIETLQAYMHIQKERLSHPLVFEVHCPPALYTLEIPTMLIQPLLENAVIHGIAHADWPGHITLVFEEIPAGIRVTVSDNGIGRQRSQEINGHKEHPSRGMELIRKKTELLQSKYQLDVAIDIKDNENNNGFGTVVTIQITALQLLQGR